MSPSVQSVNGLTCFLSLSARDTDAGAVETMYLILK